MHSLAAFFRWVCPSGMADDHREEAIKNGPLGEAGRFVWRRLSAKERKVLFILQLACQIRFSRKFI